MLSKLLDVAALHVLQLPEAALHILKERKHSSSNCDPSEFMNYLFCFLPNANIDLL